MFGSWLLMKGVMSGFNVFIGTRYKYMDGDMKIKSVMFF